MFISEACIGRINISKSIFFFFQLKCLNINAAFQVFLDLCLFRGWKCIRIIYDKFLQLYIITGYNPKKERKKIQIFFPIYFNIKLIPDISEKILKFLLANSLFHFSKKINLAVVDQDSTIVYYSLVFNIHKTIGPFV